MYQMGNKLKRGQAFLNFIHNMYYQSAKKRELDFKLSKEQLYGLIIQPCYLCGDEPTKQLKAGVRNFNGKFNHHGVDRKNNKRGYTVKNSRPCCNRCNKFKRGYSLKYIKKLIRVWKKSGNF